MKSISITLLMFIAGFLSAFSQTADSDTTYWQKSFSGGINFNQASFSNWSGGGINSYSLGALINTRALYKKDKWSWDNTADLQLGYVYQDVVGTKVRKSADQIFINSVAGYKIGPKWDLFISGTFNTFFAPGYLYGKKSDPIGGDSLVSKFMSPGQMTLAWGFAYKPADWFSLRLSPFSPRFTFVLNDDVRNIVNGEKQIAYGVEPGKKVHSEWLAFQLQATVNKQLNKNVSLKAGYLMYANYERLPKIDHRLDVALSAKLTKLISAQFGFVMVYNEDYSFKVQTQQTIGIGLLYNVSTFKDKK